MGTGEFTIPLGNKRSSKKQESVDMHLFMFSQKTVLNEKFLFFKLLGETGLSRHSNSWDICEKCVCGHLRPWHSQHGVPCWTNRCLFSFLVASQPYNPLQAAHAIVIMVWTCQNSGKLLPSGIRIFSCHLCTTEQLTYTAHMWLPSLCWKQVE